jgi:hypothetical protein
VPSYGHDLQLSLCGTEEQRRRDMQDMGAVFGSEPVDPYGDGTHLEVARKFGPVKYFVHFASEAFTEEFNEQRRLGREALAAKKAAEQEHDEPEPFCRDEDDDEFEAQHREADARREADAAIVGDDSPVHVTGPVAGPVAALLIGGDAR